jgi:hypothetical protein
MALYPTSISDFNTRLKRGEQMLQISSPNFYPRPLALRRRNLLAGAAAAHLLPGAFPAAHAEISGPETALSRADWIALERTLHGGRILLPGAQKIRHRRTRQSRKRGKRQGEKSETQRRAGRVASARLPKNIHLAMRLPFGIFPQMGWSDCIESLAAI